MGLPLEFPDEIGANVALLHNSQAQPVLQARSQAYSILSDTGIPKLLIRFKMSHFISPSAF